MSHNEMEPSLEEMSDIAPLRDIDGYDEDRREELPPLSLEW